MTNKIQLIQTDETESWSNSVHIPRYPSGTLRFLVVGGLFENGTNEIEVTTNNFGMYNFSVSAAPPKNQYESKHVTVYYDYAGQWTLIQSASRNIVRTKTKTVSTKVMLKGFEDPSKSDLPAEDYPELIIGFGSATLDSESFKSLEPKKLSEIPLDESKFNYKNNYWFVPDRATSRIHFLNNPESMQDLIRVKTLNIPFVDAYSYYSPATHRRLLAIFQEDGTILPYDVQLVAQPEIKLPYRIVRVVQLKSTDAFDPLFAVIDVQGRIHKLDSTFTELSVKDDQYYVNVHESLDAYILRSGELVGNDVWKSDKAKNFFYAFPPDSTDVYAIDFSTGLYSRFAIKTGVKFGGGSADSDLLRYPTTNSDPNATPIFSYGKDTTGRLSFAAKDAAILDVDSRYWSYLGIVSNGATVPKFGYVARPTKTLTHTVLPDYTSSLPEYDTPLGKKVTFSFVADIADEDEILPISLPDGIEWKAFVGDQQVVNVRAGDSVTIEASHEYLTVQPFPFSVGRSQALVEVIPDPMPDEFIFETIYDVPDYSWQQTATVQMRGINERIEFTVLIDGERQDDRVEVWVNDELQTYPYFMNNEDSFYLRIKHGFNITLIDITAGEYQTSYGIYTVSEIEFDPFPSYAYALAGREYRTPVFTNTGIRALDLTIDTEMGEFIQGGKAVSLEVGQSTQVIVQADEPDKKYYVHFGSSRYKYEWNIWTHEHWLDELPSDVLSNGMVLAESEPYKFDAIPDNFLTNIRVPAGVLFEIDGKVLEAELDSRGVYKNSFVVENVSCDSVLVMESYPSHDQPRVLTLGNAPAPWLHDFAGDVPTEYAFDSKSASVTTLTDASKSVQISNFSSTVLEAGTSDVHRFDQAYDYGLRKIHDKFDTLFDFSVKRIAREFDQTYAHDKIRVVDSFDQTYAHDKIRVVDSFDQTYGNDLSNVADSVSQHFDQAPVYVITTCPLIYQDWKDFAEHTALPKLYAAFDVKHEVKEAMTFIAAFEDQSRTMSLPDMESGFDSLYVENRSNFDSIFDSRASEYVPEIESGFDSRASDYVPEIESGFDSKSQLLVPKIKSAFVDVAQKKDLLSNHSHWNRSNPVFSIEPKLLSEVHNLMPAIPPSLYEPVNIFVEVVPNWINSPEKTLKENIPLWNPPNANDGYFALEPSITDTYAASAQYDNWKSEYFVLREEAHFDNWDSKYIDLRAPAKYQNWSPTYTLVINPRYHDMFEGDSLRYIQPAADFKPPSPKWFQLNSQYTIGSKEHFVPSPLTYEYLSAARRASSEESILRVERDLNVRQANAIIQRSMECDPRLTFTVHSSESAYDPAPAPQVYKYDASTVQLTHDQGIRLNSSTYRMANSANYQADKMELVLFVPTESSEKDPLKKGYFATELDALQNAVNVWNRSPEEVFGIQQFDGTWTWAVKITCGEYCGDFGCDVRGYIAGG